MGKTREPRWIKSTGLRGATRKDHFTPRQREVMGLLSQAKSYKEIARELGISTQTVKSHLRIIFDRLDVDSSAQAVIAWRERGERAHAEAGRSFE